MISNKLGTPLKFATIALALAVSDGASATESSISGQYDLSVSTTKVSDHDYIFTYTVDNLAQGLGAGTQTGLDGFTIYIPTGAKVESSNLPVAPNGAPGYWQLYQQPSLDLRGDGSQNMVAKDGYTTLTWWGQYTQSVYESGTAATFTVELSNISLGTNTVGISSYYGWGATPTGQQVATNEYGHYTTFTLGAASAVAAVPEPETYAMLLAGLGMMGFVARRRKA